jgi:hypothetical protein
MSAEKGHRRLIAVGKDRLAEIAEQLPEGGLPEDVEVLGGFVASEADEASFLAEEAPMSHCVTVVSKQDHEIHVGLWCGGGDEWEIVSETVIASL